MKQKKQPKKKQNSTPVSPSPTYQFQNFNNTPWLAFCLHFGYLHSKMDSPPVANFLCTQQASRAVSLSGLFASAGGGGNPAAVYKNSRRCTGNHDFLTSNIQSLLIWLTNTPLGLLKCQTRISAFTFKRLKWPNGFLELMMTVLIYVSVLFQHPVQCYLALSV